MEQICTIDLLLIFILDPLNKWVGCQWQNCNPLSMFHWIQQWLVGEPIVYQHKIQDLKHLCRQSLGKVEAKRRHFVRFFHIPKHLASIVRTWSPHFFGQVNTINHFTLTCACMQKKKQHIILYWHRTCVVYRGQPYSICKLLILFLADYVDEVFGDKSLWPSAPHQKALTRLLVSDFGDKVR